MTQEDKKLLLQDLCARLPYGVKISTNRGPELMEALAPFSWMELKISGNFDFTDLVGFKPYLRPMSSMTEEEDKEWQIYKNSIAESCDERLKERISELHDWFNCHHFDYRGLVEKGLAIEVTEENNPYKQ